MAGEAVRETEPWKGFASADSVNEAADVGNVGYAEVMGDKKGCKCA